MRTDTAAAQQPSVSEVSHDATVAPGESAATVKTGAKQAGRLKRILVVDDEPLNIEYLNKVLTKAGYEPVQTQRAKDALLMLAQEPFDLVLADIMMPEMDGITMVGAIRRELKLGSLPIIMCTAANDRDQVIAAAKHNIQGYLLKPINRQALLERIAEVFSTDHRANASTA